MIFPIILLTLLGFACFSSIRPVEAERYYGGVQRNTEHVSSSSDENHQQIINLKLAVSVMERNINEINRELQNLKEKYEKLSPTMEKRQSYDEDCADSSECLNRDGIMKTTPQMETAQQEPSGITYSDGKYTYHNIRISHLLDEPKFCIRNTDGDLECSSLPLPSSCADSSLINCWNNKCRIRNHLYGRESFLVACEARTEFGGGWTIIQRRVNNSVDFNRNWSEYKKGFGDFDGNYWIGLDKLYTLANKWNPVQLYIRLTDFNNVETFEKYEFSIRDETSNYAINDYLRLSGTMRNFIYLSANCKFSTKDRGNEDLSQTINGGWWNCKDPYSSVKYYNNMNGGEYYGVGEGPYKTITTGGIYLTDRGVQYAYKYIEMMIRPLTYS